MENFAFMLISFILGILFIWFSQHKESYKKTAAVQGEESANRKFRLIKLGGYLLIIGAFFFGAFIIADMVNK